MLINCKYILTKLKNAKLKWSKHGCCDAIIKSFDRFVKNVKHGKLSKYFIIFCLCWKNPGKPVIYIAPQTIPDKWPINDAFIKNDNSINCNNGCIHFFTLIPQNTVVSPGVNFNIVIKYPNNTPITHTLKYENKTIKSQKQHKSNNTYMHIKQKSLCLFSITLKNLYFKNPYVDIDDFVNQINNNMKANNNKTHDSNF